MLKNGTNEDIIKDKDYDVKTKTEQLFFDFFSFKKRNDGRK